jgi:hypothetical protein
LFVLSISGHRGIEQHAGSDWRGKCVDRKLVQPIGREPALPDVPIFRVFEAAYTYCHGTTRNPVGAPVRYIVEDWRAARRQIRCGPGVHRKQSARRSWASGLVRVCTFHPRYGYEDFIEGLRPKTVNGQMVFESRDGIFKRLCADAAHQLSRHFFRSGRNQSWRCAPHLRRVDHRDRVGQTGHVDHASNQRLIVRGAAERLHSRYNEQSRPIDLAA